VVSWLTWFMWFVSFNQKNQTDQTNQPIPSHSCHELWTSSSSFVLYAIRNEPFIFSHQLHVICHTLMSVSHPRDPLHGITLESIIKELVGRFGWAEMGRRVPIRCFLHDPSVKSSLTFLRKTPWARERVEGWYIAYKDM
jgi:hypothetical protein